MKKRFGFVSFVLICSLLLCACSLIEVDQAMDSQEIIAEVGELKVLKAECQYMLEMYAAYGIVDTNSDESVKTYKEIILDGLISEKVKEYKAKELGFANFDEAERAKITEEFDANWADTVSQYQEHVKTLEGNENKTDEEIQKIASDLMVEYGATQEAIMANIEATYAKDKLDEDTIKDIRISDEEVKATFDENVVSEKATLDADPAAYSGTYFVPTDGSRVKHILIPFADDVVSAITALESEAYDSTGAVINQAKVDELEQYQKDELEKIKADADAVLEKTKTEDFESLIDTYGKDPGMEAGKSDRVYGYVINPTNVKMVQTFHDASLALKEGEVSILVPSKHGYHIIKRYPDTITFLPEVQKLLHDTMLSTATQKAQDDALAAWTKELEDAKMIKKHMSRWG